MGECWGSGTATFLMLGDVCTRTCGFCDVKHGRPEVLDWLEPERVAQAVMKMNLKHAVITSVNRDKHLHDWGVDILTIGQYLQPSRKHLPIKRYYEMDEFEALKEYGLGLGFKWVESSPLVRSSYHAGEQVQALSAVHHKLYAE